MNGEILLKTLPKYLKDDIDALLKGLEVNASAIDCLYNEVQGSINSAFYIYEITLEEANYLRRKYLSTEI